MINLSLNITSTTLTLQNISGNDITLTVGLTTNELSLSLDRGVSLETVKADLDIKNAIDKAHAQNTDTILDEGGDNEVTAAQAKAGYTHSQVTSGNPHGTEKEDISGLKIGDTPEFVDDYITGLNTAAETGGGIDPTLWAWIQSVFSSIVAKSVKSHIIGLWTKLYNSEPKLLVDYTVPSNVTLVSITTDSQGNPLSILPSKKFKIVAELLFVSTNNSSNIDGRASVKVNNISTNYLFGTISAASFQPGVSNGYKHFWEIDGFIDTRTFFNNISWLEKLSGTRSVEIYPCALMESISDLNRIDIVSVASATYLIGTGSKIKIYRQ